MYFHSLCWTCRWNNFCSRGFFSSFLRFTRDCFSSCLLPASTDLDIAASPPFFSSCLPFPCLVVYMYVSYAYSSTVCCFCPAYRSKPLQIWNKQVRNGHIKRITDDDIQSSVLELMGTNVSTNFITCPADPKKTLGIKLPFLVMIIKNVCPLRDFFYFVALSLSVLF